MGSDNGNKKNPLPKLVTARARKQMFRPFVRGSRSTDAANDPNTAKRHSVPLTGAAETRMTVQGGGRQIVGIAKTRGRMENGKKFRTGLSRIRVRVRIRGSTGSPRDQSMKMENR